MQYVFQHFFNFFLGFFRLSNAANPELPVFSSDHPYPRFLVCPSFLQNRLLSAAQIFISIFPLPNPWIFNMLRANLYPLARACLFYQML